MGSVPHGEMIIARLVNYKRKHHLRAVWINLVAGVSRIGRYDLWEQRWRRAPFCQKSSRSFISPAYHSIANIQRGRGRPVSDWFATSR
jgi:hypothetical protein